MNTHLSQGYSYMSHSKALMYGNEATHRSHSKAFIHWNEVNHIQALLQSYRLGQML